MQYLSKINLEIIRLKAKVLNQSFWK